MPRLSTLLPFALTALAGVDALSLYKRDAPATLELPITGYRSSRPLQKRDSTGEIPVTNGMLSYYSLNLTLGTPAQHLSLALDTGSSDIWVNVADSDYCSGKGDVCKPYGFYDSDASSTSKSVGTSFNNTYAGGTNAYGPYLTDKLKMGDVEIDHMQFGVAEQSTSRQGIVGIGYDTNTNQGQKGKIYPNLPQALVDSGAIKSPAYSIWLNDLLASQGSILFGGVNKAKYHGSLQSVPVIPVYGRYYSLAIALTEVSVENGDDSKSIDTTLPLAVSLDTGSVLTMLPKKLVDKIYSELDATYVEKYGVAYIDCDKANKDYSIKYSFSGATITVGIDELVFPAAEPGFPKGTCIFGIVPSAEGVNLLGDTFLRSAYVVYDLANNEVSLANTNFKPGDEDIHEIGTGTDAVPGATRVKSAVSSATGNGVATATAGGPTLPGVTQTAVAGTGTAAAESTSSGLGAMPTGNIKLLSGLAGAGLLLAL
ncbi:aspartic peptidase domain-containing protein [Aspergillus avenaceus]|uniref:Probable aspartic-type endopeptidase OPSB n=1 Tax=Aspergillus avenaceus TaxID=36643 RepID=A0A5N6TN22_ASPAV|nr:aspartic peptidase domain-containing protein [Aspergillus avenaceus]